MSGLHIDFRDLQKVLDQFDSMDTPYYQVYEGKSLKFISPVVDSDASEEQTNAAGEFFKSQLEAIKACGNTGSFRVDWYSGLNEKGNYVKEKLKGSNTFKLNEIGEISGGGYLADRKTFVTPQMQQLMEENNALRSQLAAQELEPEEDDEENTQGATMNGILAGVMPILQRPEVQQAIAGRIIGFLDQILPQKKSEVKTMGNTETVQAGPLTEDQTQTVYQCINTLLGSGMQVSDFEKLARLASDPAKFQNYLNLMRTMLP